MATTDLGDGVPVAALPAEVRRLKVPSKARMFWPEVPAKSRANMYSGCPAYVTWVVPSDRWTVPRADGLNPELAPMLGAPPVRTGVQIREQRSLQAEAVVEASSLNAYSGLVAKLRTVPKETTSSLSLRGWERRRRLVKPDTRTG